MIDLYEIIIDNERSSREFCEDFFGDSDNWYFYYSYAVGKWVVQFFSEETAIAFKLGSSGKHNIVKRGVRRNA
jgi:hypothetical protein